MTLNVKDLLLLGILCATVHWLFARSYIMKPLWSRARGLLAKLLACPACSGAWIGLSLGVLAGVMPVVPPPDSLLPFWAQVPIRAACNIFLGMFLTPVFETVLVYALRASAIPEPEPEVHMICDAGHAFTSTDGRCPVCTAYDKDGNPVAWPSATVVDTFDAGPTVPPPIPGSKP